MLGGLSSYLFVHFHIATLLASVRLDELEEQNAMMAHKYFAIRTFFFAFVCTVGDYFIFHNKRYTFPEIVVVNIFTFIGVSMLHLLSIPILLLGKYFDISIYLRVILVIIVILYIFLVRFQFYNAKGNNPLIIKIIAAILLYVAIILTVTETVVKPFFSE